MFFLFLAANTAHIYKQSLANVFNLALLLFVDSILLCTTQGANGRKRNGGVEVVEIGWLVSTFLFASSVHSSLSIFQETLTNWV